MNSIILIMSITGSVSFILYYIIRYTCKSFISSKHLYFLLKISMLCFLLPLAPIGYEMRLNLYDVLNRHPFEDYDAMGKLAQETIYISREGDINIPSIHKTLIYLFIAWSIIFLFLIVRQIIQYRRYRTVLSIAREDITQNIQSQYQTVNDLLNSSKKVQIYFFNKANTPYTVGYLHPQIILPKSTMSEEHLEFIFKHELMHIKNRDYIVKIIGLIILALHWFNPLAYLLFREISVRCECSCDEQIAHSMNKEQIISYGNLILQMSAKTEPYIDKFRQMPVNAFSSNQKKLLKERIYYMKKNRKNKKRYISLGIVGTFLFSLCSVLPALAYTPINIQASLSPDEMCFSGEEYDIKYSDINENLIDPSIPAAIAPDGSESYYYTEDGTILDIAPPLAESETRHTHNYKKVEFTEHKRNSSGGCTQKVYSLQKCSGCKAEKNKTLLSTLTLSKCKH